LVRYEDLVQDPERELRSLTEHLGIDYHGAMLTGSEESRRYWESLAADRFHDSWGADPLSGISRERVGRYLRDLRPEDEAVFWKVRLRKGARRKLSTSLRGAADLMALFGYPRVPERALPKVRLGVKWTALRAYWNRMLLDLRYRRRLYWPATTV